MKKVTIKDIANIAGVSRGTVDRVINNRGNVAPKIEKKILKIASELGYEKNLLASNLAYQKSYKLAVVTPDPEHDYFWEQPRIGIQKALEFVKHYGIETEFFDFIGTDKEDYSRQLENAVKTLPNAILTAPSFTLEFMEYVSITNRNKIPFITINSDIDHKNILAYTGQNSYSSGYLAGKLLHMSMVQQGEIIVINLGHSLYNAKHYSDKFLGLKAYFSEHELPNKITKYEFSEFMDEIKMKDFWKELNIKHTKIKGIFFTNSRAYRLLNVIPENETKKMVIVGFDLVLPNIELLKSGKIDFLINQNPMLQGYQGVMNFVDHFVLGKNIPEKQYLPLDIVVKENVDFYTDYLR